MDLFICPTPTPIQPQPLPQLPQLSQLSQLSPPSQQVPVSPLTVSPLFLSTTTTSPPLSSSPPSATSSPSPPSPPLATPSQVLPFLLTRQTPAASQLMDFTFQHQPQHSNDNDEVRGIPFKVWRSQHMMNTQVAHNNIPVAPPLPSTQREKHLRRKLRDIQLQLYKEWNNKDTRQRRLGRTANDDDGDHDTLARRQQQNGDGAGRRIRFTLPSKLKRSRSSSSSFSD